MIWKPLNRVNAGLLSFAIAAVVSLLVLGGRELGLLRGLEFAAFDHFVSLLPTGDQPPRVAVVEVSEEDIQELATYPIPDGALAQVIENILDTGARAVGLDIYRDIPVPPGSGDLERAFVENPRVVVLYKLADENASGVRPPKVLEGSDQLGFNNMVIDSDGIVRRGLLYMDDGKGGQEIALAYNLALIYLSDDGVFPEAPEDPPGVQLGPATLRPLNDRFGGYVRADVGGFQYALDWREAPSELPVVSFSDALANVFDEDIFWDRVVMIGVGAESLTDRFQIPFSPGGGNLDRSMTGVQVHARMTDQLIRQASGQIAPLRATEEWQEIALIVLFAVASAALMLWIRNGPALTLLAVAGLIALWAIGRVSLLQGVWVPVVPPAAAWTASLALVAAYSRSRERAERSEIMQLFARHVTKQVAEDIWRNRDEYLEGGRPKSVRLTATILFVDIKGYTGNVEKMDPSELMQWINGFLGAMAEEVLSRGGMVEDYFGDGMMACYGIPIARTDQEGIEEDARSAVRTAIGMATTLRRLNEEWALEGRPAVGIRVGVCTGAVVAGSMGSADRLKYGVVGDAVVTAQRLESLGLDRVEHDFDKQPSRILISEATHEMLGGSFATEHVGEFQVKGKDRPVVVHRVLEVSEEVEA